MAEPMQQQAERYLGTAIEPQEWRRACESAERKLQYIIKHYGDSGGQRREPWYMAPAYRRGREKRPIAAAHGADRGLLYGDKKDSPCPKTQGRPSTTPIVA